MTSTGSCLIIEVSAAEPAVRSHRGRLDASARTGMPAHITVLAPFMLPEATDPTALAELERVCTGVGRFHYQLDRTGWFGDQVLWLGPRDARPFRARLPIDGYADAVTWITREAEADWVTAATFSLG